MYPKIKENSVELKGSMKEVQIQSITPAEYEPVAKTYAQVFAGEPWREVSRCSQCGEFSSANPGDQEQCACGGEFSIEAYPLEETAEYVGKELSKPDAIGLLVSQLSLMVESIRVVNGFSWGFRMNQQDLQKKYRTDEMRDTVAALLINAGFFYYVSEVGVLPNLQGQGWGKRLTSSLVGQAEQIGYDQFVVRTNEDSAMRYILEKMGMQPILGLQTGIKDAENEKRVLFVAKR